MTNKLSIYIVEDNARDCANLIADINAHPDKLSLVGTTSSSHEAFEFIRDHKPHAVILDLELQNGIGDGTDLLTQLSSTLIYPKPYIVVNTNCPNSITRMSAKKKGADYEFAKWQEGYTTKMVIDHLLFVRPEILGIEEKAPAPLTEVQLENKMRIFLQQQFNSLGLSAKQKGQAYLVDAVILAAKCENQNWAKIIGDKFRKTEDSVTKAMKYALKCTWTKADTNDLKNYPAPLRKDQDSPTVCEFVYTYKQELIKHINN